KYIFNIRIKNAVDSHISSMEKDPQTVTGSVAGKILESILKAKATLNQKTITLTVARSLKETEEAKNIFLTRPAMKLLKNEILAANYLVKEELI
ncbi:MAG TPA: hypothetical protein VN381_12540, partial [Anaerovoracaceae bacterium]|nr:hypothetical protein [Anaerovoracaceae bacterium]